MALLQAYHSWASDPGNHEVLAEAAQSVGWTRTRPVRYS